MEYVRETLIKECGNGLHDKVFIVMNLPKHLLFEKVAKMVPRVDRDGYKDGTMVPDPKGGMVWALYPGIEFSLTGDLGLCFWPADQESRGRLADIDRYIETSFPRDQRYPKRVEYAQVLGSPSSPPKPYHTLPRVFLPWFEESWPIVDIKDILFRHQTESKEPLEDTLGKSYKMSEEGRSKLNANLEKARMVRKAKAEERKARLSNALTLNK